VEAEETYRNLSAKSRRVTTDGFGANWSPDGKKLAFSLGVHGYSGVAIYDPATKETDLLIVPGKDPKWSPDGRHIAFVRDCQLLRLEELATVERENQHRAARDEEVWVMNADGTEPRLLARGSWPAWGRDSQHIYYLSRGDGMLCSVSLAGQDAEPKRFIKCADSLPSVSPDNQRVSYFEGGSLKIKDLASQTSVVECAAPFSTWGVTAWSPTGNEVCLGGSSPGRDKTGLWIYDLSRKAFLRVLDGQIVSASWSPRATQLAFCLGPPYYEVWAARLDPNIPTVEALGPGQTSDEYVEAMLALNTRRIEADPLDAYAYSDRARYYDCLHDREKAAADMRRWSAAASGQPPCDSRRVVNLPFDCQFVFSAERPVNAIPTMSVAFEQKGRCKMKLFEVPMFVASLCGFCAVAGLDAPPAYGNFTFGEPVNLKTVIPVIDPTHDGICCFSYDGLEIYILSDRPGGSGDFDLWVLRRASQDQVWGPPENLGPAVNSPQDDFSSHQFQPMD
jgi:Tol biopolymer transport system component